MAKKVIKETSYNCGWFCRWHKSDVNMIAHTIGLIVLGYGLWMHSWIYSLSGIGIMLLGHLIQHFIK